MLYVTLKPHKFFGYRREMLGGLPVLVADEAKAIVDCLDQSRYAGGMLEVGQALHTALPELDVDLLVDYAIRILTRTQRKFVKADLRLQI
jgi:predicted transcriptional regulator of viral defense system